MLIEIIWIKIGGIALLFYGSKKILTPIGWKSIGSLLPWSEKTIAKACELHDGIRKCKTRVIEDSLKIGRIHSQPIEHLWTLRAESKCNEGGMEKEKNSRLLL